MGIGVEIDMLVTPCGWFCIRPAEAFSVHRGSSMICMLYNCSHVSDDDEWERNAAL